jgi:hypothetical protein
MSGFEMRQKGESLEKYSGNDEVIPESGFDLYPCLGVRTIRNGELR